MRIGALKALEIFLRTYGLNHFHQSRVCHQRKKKKKRSSQSKIKAPKSLHLALRFLLEETKQTGLGGESLELPKIS